jgi:hypothetical protein
MPSTFVDQLSPKKRRHLCLSGNPAAFPQTKQLDVSKPLRCDIDPFSEISLTRGIPETSPIQEAMLYTMNTDPRTGNVPDNPSVTAFIPASVSQFSGASESLSVIEKQSHSFRQQLQDKMSMDKGTEVAYLKHLKRYEDYWIQDQEHRESEARASGGNWEFIDPHPITVTKVCIFLEYESTRNKVRI